MISFKLIAAPSKPLGFIRGGSLDNVFNPGRRPPRCSYDQSFHVASEENAEDFFSSDPVLSLNVEFLSLVEPIIIKISEVDFVLGRRLGHGAQGEVFRCEFNGESCVVKVEPIESHVALKTEAAFLCLLQKRFSDETWFPHPRAYFVDEKKSYLVMNNLGQSVVAADLTYDAIEQLFRILCKLKGANIIHCDIKPGNVMIADGVISLCDFGLGLNKKMAPGHLYKVHHGSVQMSTDSSTSTTSIPSYLQREFDEAPFIPYVGGDDAASTPLLMPVGTAGHIAPTIIRGDGMRFTSYGGDRFSVGSTIFELAFPDKRLAEHYFTHVHSDDPIAYLCTMMDAFEPSYHLNSRTVFGIGLLPSSVEELCVFFNSDSCLEKNPLIFFMHLMVHPNLDFLSSQEYLQLFHKLIPKEQFDAMKLEAFQ